ncbi:hydroxymethylbilane synthase [Aquella oligotrophica]|uniref:Porphobilinogen deaminase n=1 Tax=Aquella oligotrophica TaxID=2067065 RepID=A0A2I7N7I7_9NEIS|nr:hydroxymethylbilane synthase [Aquella oligotrophica]AUR52427.1 hydroxymethylbilane synthase [Aquella oligotrophica]
MQKIRIISRNSQLAMWQANHVKEKLISANPGLFVDIIGITTEGDRILDKSLEKIGGKGLFIKELEYQLLHENADIAVHSLKDLPAKLPEEFILAAILEREDPHDAFVSNNYQSIDELPDGAIVGTSSARRSAILRKYYPQLEIKLLRGNLQTRLAKLDNGDYDAIILAVAGLKRLGLAERIKTILPAKIFVPAIGQGVLAVEILASRKNELLSLLKKIEDIDTSRLVGAEREMGRFMNASCNVPIAGYARMENNQLHLSAIIADPDNVSFYTAEITGDPDSYLQIGQECARLLLADGAQEILGKYL